MWNDETKSYEFTKTKHCYSKIILENRSEFNYYKASYCDEAFQGLSLAVVALGASLVAVLSF